MSAMLIEHRVYQLRPGQLTPFLELVEREGLPIQLPILGRLVGYFHTEIGALNRVIHIWGFQSYEDRALRRAQLAADTRWKTFSAKVLPMIVTMENSLLTPAPFSPIS